MLRSAVVSVLPDDPTSRYDDAAYWDQRARQVGGRDAAFHGIDWDHGTNTMAATLLERLPDEGVLFDLGCGVGRLTVPVARARPEVRVVGLDVSQVMLDQADRSAANVTYRHCDGRVVPLRAESMDGGWSMLVFQHLPTAAVCSYLRGVSIVLEPGGVFVAQYVPGDHAAPRDVHHDPDVIDTAAANIGLEAVHVEDGWVHPQWRLNVWQRR